MHQDVTNILQAWLESLTYQPGGSDAVFTERKAFIRLWKDSPFDPFYINRYHVPKMQKRLKWLAQRLENRQHLSEEELAAQLKAGTATRETALLWVLQQAQASQSDGDAVVSGVDDVQTFADEMLQQVPWDSEVLVALRGAVDADLPREVRDKDRVKAGLIGPSYVTTEHVFNKIFEVRSGRGGEAEKDPGVGVTVLGGMLSGVKLE